METGFSPAKASETPLHRLQLQVYVSQRVELDAAAWRLDLLSPFWRVYVNHRAGAFLLFENERFDLLPNQLAIVPAWVRFQTGTQPGVTQDHLHFYLSGFAPTTLRALFDRPYFFDLETPLGALVAAWRATLDRELGGHAPKLSDFSGVYALAHAALAACAKCAEVEKAALISGLESDSNLVAPALARLETRLDTPPTNRELARDCGLSTDHFIRLFRRDVGQTPAQYGLQNRVAVAARLLLSTSQSIEQIAAATGFSDRFHFSKSFKSRFRIAPGAYRALHRNRS